MTIHNGLRKHIGVFMCKFVEKENAGLSRYDIMSCYKVQKNRGWVYIYIYIKLMQSSNTKYVFI